MAESGVADGPQEKAPALAAAAAIWALPPQPVLDCINVDTPDALLW
jgi:hypothetical protein